MFFLKRSAALTASFFLLSSASLCFAQSDELAAPVQTSVSFASEESAQNLTQSIAGATTGDTGTALEEALGADSVDEPTKKGVRLRYKKRKLFDNVEMPQRVFNNVPPSR